MSIKELFDDQGYVLIKDFFSADEKQLLQNFTNEWIGETIRAASSGEINEGEIDLKYYHTIVNIDHSRVAAAIHRYIVPNESILNALEKSGLVKLIKELSDRCELIRWQDPGFGWLGYRIIRPNCNDGYPPSCKDWGAASGVYSLWVPIAGCTRYSSIRFLPGSHKKKYSSFLPEETQFTKGERRLCEDIPESSFVRHDCTLGDMIVYHPSVIHSEDSSDKELTRVNLEYRYRPQ
jgi:ectoine hydroxylase-related dioxygenase (phytanoyl-CoA dioxygenase family)